MEKVINPLKGRTIEGMLKAFALPHKELLCRIVEWHCKAEDEAKKAEGKIPRTDFNHFEDVVKYMNALLDRKFSKILDQKSLKSKEFKNLEEIIVNLNAKAKPLLLCTAVYHDIGKAIIRPRHGPEGADIIKDSGYEDRERFFALGFTRSDIYLMSDLIRFHDYLAMVGTGEASYLIFTEVLYTVTNISLTSEKEFLDYLLLLNLADVAGTIGKISSEDFTRLMHDFKLIKKAHNGISKKVYEEIFKKEPNEINEEQLYKETILARDLIDIISELQRLTENNTGERLRRLLRAGFRTSMGRLRKQVKGELDAYDKDCIKREYRRIGQYEEAKEFEKWFVKEDIGPIIASLRSLNIGQEFYTKFAFICKLDYELGFISELIEEMIRTEIKDFKTGSLRIRSPHDLRRDLAMCLVKLVDTLVKLFGDFTSNNIRIGLGFERLTAMERTHKEKFLRRLTGEDGGFKEAEALTKLRGSTNLWVITP